MSWQIEDVFAYLCFSFIFSLRVFGFGLSLFLLDQIKIEKLNSYYFTLTQRVRKQVDLPSLGYRRVVIVISVIIAIASFVTRPDYDKSNDTTAYGLLCGAAGGGRGPYGREARKTG